MAQREYFELCNISAITSKFQTETKFSNTFGDAELSPIDSFIINTKELNKLLRTEYTPALGNLILLGYVSAAESYFRTLIRKLINVDEYIHSIITEKTVSYAAAYHHTKDLLPEALLENCSFASPNNINETLKDILGIKGTKPDDVNEISKEFSKICELRHCCVHRFGKLGSKNATKLGLDNHSHYLEKPIKLAKEDIDELANIVTSFVKIFNNYIYKMIIERTVNNKNKEKAGERYYKEEWSWNFNKDKRRFKKYYDIFYTREDSVKSAPIKESYNLFRSTMKKV
jgi:hypothetical protein